MGSRHRDAPRPPPQETSTPTRWSNCSHPSPACAAPCTALARLTLANVMENLVEGRVINQIFVPENINVTLSCPLIGCFPYQSRLYSVDDIRTNTLIIGCGIAGAATALRLSDNPNHHVTIITRCRRCSQTPIPVGRRGASSPAVLGDLARLARHDILEAGAGPQFAQKPRDC